MKKLIIALFLVLILSLQANDKLETTENLTPEDIKEAVKDIKKDSVASKTGFEKFIKEFEKIEGFFTLYRDNEEGKVFLEIKPDQFEEVYLCTMTRQSGDAYMFDASSSLWNFPFFFKKVNKRIQLIEKNLKFRADDPAMKRAIENSFSNSIMASAKMSCKPNEQTGSILIDAGDLFLKDMTNVENSTSRRKNKFSFDKENSYFDKLKSFPNNTEIDVVLHFKNNAGKYIYTLPDSRSMNHRYHYSLSIIPETNYKSRLADDRIGLFTTIFQDYTDVLTESPYVRYINRWHIEKEDPAAKLSKPKEPIVFWLENTIPLKYRPAVRKGILLWNEAFEEIGFEDAIVVKEMPDDADWDPADARYNTICWIIQPGGGYAVGPSHANPYTGQIYDADIRVSVDFLRFFYREYDEVVNPGGWINGLRSANWEPEEFIEHESNHECRYSDGLSEQMSFAFSVLNSRGLFSSGKLDLEEFVEQGLIDLICHEVGHTLGLRHNFKGSSVFSNEQLQNKNFTEKNGVVSSIMDYNPINLSAVDKEQGNYFQNRVGVWDKWMIEYGYSVIDPEKEEIELAKIAQKCTKPILDFGTDSDASGYSSRGVDPLCSIFDLSSDPISYYEDRIESTKKMWADISKNFEKKGESYKKLLMVYNQGIGEYYRAAQNSCKFIGGLYSSRDHIGDPGGRIPYNVIPADEQRRALSLITQNIFSEDAFNFPPELLNKFVYEKMGTFTGGIWSRSRMDYPVHNTVSYIQSIAISHLYDPIRLARILDNELKFEKKEEKFRMPELFDTIRSSIWNEIPEQRNINSFRRELQRMHLHRLSEIILNKNEAIPNDAISLTRADLTEIKNKIINADRIKLDKITNAHLSETLSKIEAVLSADMNLD